MEIMIESLKAKAVALQTRKATALKVAEPTGLEPATSDVTGRRSNQLNYDSARKPINQMLDINVSVILTSSIQNLTSDWWARRDSNPQPPPCKGGRLPLTYVPEKLHPKIIASSSTWFESDESSC